MNELIRTFLELHKIQPKILLSGSVALNLAGIKTRRLPNDLDIFVPRDCEIPELEGMEFIEDSETYAECDFVRLSYKYKDVRIDFFTPERRNDFSPQVILVDVDINEEDVDINEETSPFGTYIHALSYQDIIGFKVSHALDIKHKDAKHKEDVIFILENN